MLNTDLMAVWTMLEAPQREFATISDGEEVTIRMPLWHWQFVDIALARLSSALSNNAPKNSDEAKAHLTIMVIRHRLWNACLVRQHPEHFNRRGHWLSRSESTYNETISVEMPARLALIVLLHFAEIIIVFDTISPDANTPDILVRNEALRGDDSQTFIASVWNVGHSIAYHLPLGTLWQISERTGIDFIKGSR